MKFGSSVKGALVAATIIPVLLGASLVVNGSQVKTTVPAARGGQAPSAKAATRTQAPASARAQKAEDVFKNVQVLKGIPVDQFMDTMGFFAASLSLNCTDCHVSESSGSWDKYADDTPIKNTARKMVLMVNTLNKNNFAGGPSVTCYTCHRGNQRPKFVPSLAEQYGTPAKDDPNEVLIPQTPGAITADQILDKYLQALGGATQVNGLMSFTAKGDYAGYDTDFGKVPVEIYAKAPAQRTTIVHGDRGDSTRTCDGKSAWIASPDKPLPLMELTGGDLNGARLDAAIFFPAQIKQMFKQWRVGTTTIDDRDVEFIQGVAVGQPPVRLFFDKQSGLLVRMVHYTNTLVGQVPAQVDFGNYREVAGVKFPFHWTATWTDGQSTTDLSNVQANAPIDAAKFAKPAPARPAIAEK